MLNLAFCFLVHCSILPITSLFLSVQDLLHLFPSWHTLFLLQMSQFLTPHPKHCAKQERLNVTMFYKKLIFALFACFIFILLLILGIWLILRPTKPEFTLSELDIYQLSLSAGPNLLNSSIQLTLFSKNPNQKVGIYYDKLQAYAAYKGQQITVDTSFPPFYQGHDDSNVLKASLVGTGLPVASSFGYEIGLDQTAGKLVLTLKVNGRLRWKVGTWVSSGYRINVNCIALVAFEHTFSAGPLIAKQGTQCSTSV